MYVPHGILCPRTIYPGGKCPQEQDRPRGDTLLLHRIKLKEQSGQGLHSLPFHLHLLNILYVKTLLFKF